MHIDRILNMRQSVGRKQPTVYFGSKNEPWHCFDFPAMGNIGNTQVPQSPKAKQTGTRSSSMPRNVAARKYIESLDKRLFLRAASRILLRTYPSEGPSCRDHALPT